MDPSEPANCIFCRIVNGEMYTQFVAESEHAVAFRDLDPKAPTHVLVVPRRHIPALRNVTSDDSDTLVDMIGLAVDVARREGIVESGYRVLTNDGPDAGQSVFHLHLHVLGGNPLQPGLG